MKRRILLLSALVFASGAQATLNNVVTQVSGTAEFNREFCNAARDKTHIFILPVEIFASQTNVSCSDGISILRVTEPQGDPGHKIYNVDPPHGVQDGLDCDGKADIGMSIIAINCVPANLETADHNKS